MSTRSYAPGAWKITMQEWESTGRIDDQMIQVMTLQFDDIMQTELMGIKSAEEPDEGFTRLSRLTAFVGAGTAKQPSILGKLQNWVTKLASTVNALAKRLGANGYSISVGWPFGVSVSISFPIS